MTLGYKARYGTYGTFPKIKGKMFEQLNDLLGGILLRTTVLSCSKKYFVFIILHDEVLHEI